MVNLNQRRVIAGKSCTSSFDCFAVGLACIDGKCSSHTYPFAPQTPSYLTPMDSWAKPVTNFPRFFDTDGKSQMIMQRANAIPDVNSEAACIHCILTHPGNPDYCRNICRYWG